MKIKMKLIIVAAILLIVTITSFCVFLTFVLNDSAKGFLDSYLESLAVSQSRAVDDYIGDIGSRFDLIKSIPAVKNYASGSFSESSDEFKAAEQALESLTNTDMVEAAVIYNNNADSVEIFKGKSKSQAAAGVCDLNASDNEAVIFSPDGDGDFYISVKSALGNKNIGVLFSGLGMQKIIDQTNQSIFVVDPNLHIASNGKNYNGILGNNSKNEMYKSFIDSASGTPAPFDADNMIGYTLKSDKTNWIVVSNIDGQEAVKPAAKASSSVTGIAVAMLVVCLVLVIIFVITITKPFYKIQDTLMKISRGDHEARVEIMSKNEYGDIARVFNDIVDTIIVSESRYRTIIEMSDNIIFEWNLQTNDVTFSNNFNKKFSYRAPSDHFADSFLLKCKVHPEDNDRYKSDLEKLAKGENFKHNEYRIKNIYGDYIWVLIRTQAILGQNGEPAKIVGVMLDIDRSKKNENVLTARASFDALTQVYNRETIETVITNEIELIAARKSEFAILFIDIDDFKQFNDNYSHATGDQVLRFTATTIRNAIGDKGSAGRYGGDEFIVCIKEAESNDPALLAEQILNTLKEGFEDDSGNRLEVNVSIGISIVKDNTRRVEEIIGHADDAMYKIKKSGKSNFGFLET